MISLLERLYRFIPFRSELYKRFIDTSNHGLKWAVFPEGFRMLLNFDTPNPALKKTFYYYKTHSHHEPNTAELFYSSIKEADIVVDIGANLGYFTLLAAKKVGRGGAVIAIEPDNINFMYLMANIALNGVSRWTVPKEVAISDKKGKAKLFVCPYDSGHHTINQAKGIKDYKDNKDKIKSYEVVTYTLDEFVRLPINVIKIDAEGAEALILKGMKKTIKKNKGLKLFIEFFPFLIKRMGNSPQQFIKDLSKDFAIAIIPQDYNAPYNMIAVKNYKELMGYIKDEKDHLNLFCQHK